MSKQFELIKRIYDLLVEYELKTRKSIEIESDIYLPDGFKPQLSVRNIQKLFIDLELGENAEYTKYKSKFEASIKEDKYENSGYVKWWHFWADPFMKLLPQSQAKALSDKWFSLREKDGQPIASLWDESPEVVLEELIEVLEGKIKSL